MALVRYVLRPDSLHPIDPGVPIPGQEAYVERLNEAGMVVRGMSRKRGNCWGNAVSGIFLWVIRVPGEIPSFRLMGKPGSHSLSITRSLL